VTIDLEHSSIAYAMTIGFDSQARPREIFRRAYRPDSDADLIADDAAVLLLIALQHGVYPCELGHSMGRHEGRPATIIGVLCDLLAADREARA
jgi:hypothetical protein